MDRVIATCFYLQWQFHGDLLVVDALGSLIVFILRHESKTLTQQWKRLSLHATEIHVHGTVPLVLLNRAEDASNLDGATLSPNSNCSVISVPVALILVSGFLPSELQLMPVRT